MALLTPHRDPGPSWPPLSSPDPISMFPSPLKRPSGPALSLEMDEPAPKRRKTYQPEPEEASDASSALSSTRTTPSMILPDSQLGGDVGETRSEVSDTPLTPTPTTEQPGMFYTSGPSAAAGVVPGVEGEKEKPPPPPLSDAQLLLMVPQLVLEPPSSPKYVDSLYVSWLALRRCFRLEALTPEVELRALTGLVELGVLVIEAELDEPWTKGIPDEAEKAVVKALAMAKAHPTLKHYLPPLQWLQVRLAVMSGPAKRALSLSRQLVAAEPQDSAAIWLHYFHHSHVLSTLTPSQTSAQTSHLNNPPPAQDLHYMRIHSLLRLSHAVTEAPEDFQGECEVFLSSFSDRAKLETSEAQLLLIGHIFALLNSASAPATEESCNLQAKILNELPEFLDDIVSASPPTLPSPSGSIPIMFPIPPKKLLLALACLVAAIASRDASGRRSKREIWATEGLKLFEEDMDELPRWYSLKQKKALERQLDEIKALLLCEIISVTIMRSEFQNAKKHIDTLIDHTCCTDLFAQFRPVISLLHGRLAHSVYAVQRAKDCYGLAMYLGRQQGDEGIRLAAHLDLLGLKLGLNEDADVEAEELLLELADWKDANLQEPAVVLRAIAAKEIHKSKQQLKFALDTATLRSDNYMRLLILCITASHYQLTKPTRAISALQACRQVCLSLGAPPEGHSNEKQPYGHGNASVGLWVGEKYAELLLRQGSDKAAKKQETINAALRKRWMATQEEMSQLLSQGEVHEEIRQVQVYEEPQPGALEEMQLEGQEEIPASA